MRVHIITKEQLDIHNNYIGKLIYQNLMVHWKRMKTSVV